MNTQNAVIKPSFKELAFNSLKSEAKKLGINTQGMNKEAIIAACDAEWLVKYPEPVIVIGLGEGKGRPIDPNSKRQLAIAERAAKKAAGIVGKKGRPIVVGSKHQIAQAERELKQTIAGTDFETVDDETLIDLATKTGIALPDGVEREVVIAELKKFGKTFTGKRGRPAEADSARQIRLAAMEAKRVSGQPLFTGRPTDPNSKRQQKLARINELKAAGTFKLGRPAAVKVESVPANLIPVNNDAGEEVKA